MQPWGGSPNIHILQNPPHDTPSPLQPLIRSALKGLLPPALCRVLHDILDNQTTDMLQRLGQFLRPLMRPLAPQPEPPGLQGLVPLPHSVLLAVVDAVLAIESPDGMDRLVDRLTNGTGRMALDGLNWTLPLVELPPNGSALVEMTEV